MSTWRERAQRRTGGAVGHEQAERTEASRRGIEGEEGKGARAREQERKEGASSPFYSESGIPGYCQVTVGRSLEEMLTLLTVVVLIFTVLT